MTIEFEYGNGDEFLGPESWRKKNSILIIYPWSSNILFLLSFVPDAEF